MGNSFSKFLRSNAKCIQVAQFTEVLIPASPVGLAVCTAVTSKCFCHKSSSCTGTELRHAAFYFLLISYFTYNIELPQAPSLSKMREQRNLLEGVTYVHVFKYDIWLLFGFRHIIQYFNTDYSVTKKFKFGICWIWHVQCTDPVAFLVFGLGHSHWACPFPWTPVLS